MNYFVSIKPFKAFQKVAYYTFQIEGEEETEAEKFFTRFEDEASLSEDLDNLVAWIAEIGERRGAKPQFFRFEDSAEALPPPAKFLTELPVRDLRLYCICLTDEIVILGNGGLKTAQKVQDCPDLLPKFRIARQAATRITEMIRDKEFRFSGKTIFDLDTLEIEMK